MTETEKDQMESAIALLLLRCYWLSVHLTAHDALLQPIARRQLDYNDLLRNSVDGTSQQFLTEMLDLGLDPELAQRVVAEGRDRILRGLEERPAN